MRIILAVSNELGDKFNIQLPCLLASHDRHVDNQLITCDRHAIALQMCSFAHRQIEPQARAHDIIIVAAYSRYSLIIPNVLEFDFENIEQQYSKIMSDCIQQILQNTGAGIDLINHTYQNCRRQAYNFDWFAYSAPNMHAHCQLIQQALADYYRTQAIGSLNLCSAQALCKPINNRAITVDASDTALMTPIERLAQEWLIRFGGGDYILLPANQADAYHGDLTGRTIASLAHADVVNMDFLRRRKLLA